MKTNPDNQSLIPEHTSNNEIFNAKGYSKFQPGEDIYRKFQNDEKLYPEYFSKPIDFKNDTFGKNNREDIKNDINRLETIISCFGFDEIQAAVRSEYKKNNPTG